MSETPSGEDGQSTSDIDHVGRIEDALEEINHLEYVEVSECLYPQADVRVQVADRMENALVNNGEFAAFHRNGYVGHHVEFDEKFIDLRYMDTDTDRSGGESDVE